MWKEEAGRGGTERGKVGEGKKWRRGKRKEEKRKEEEEGGGRKGRRYRRRGRRRHCSSVSAVHTKDYRQTFVSCLVLPCSSQSILVYS